MVGVTGRADRIRRVIRRPDVRVTLTANSRERHVALPFFIVHFHLRAPQSRFPNPPIPNACLVSLVVAPVEMIG